MNKCRWSCYWFLNNFFVWYSSDVMTYHWKLEKNATEHEMECLTNINVLITNTVNITGFFIYDFYFINKQSIKITEKHICIINVPSEMKIICYYILSFGHCISLPYSIRLLITHLVSSNFSSVKPIIDVIVRSKV
jgi:hypothetical protein